MVSSDHELDRIGAVDRRTPGVPNSAQLVDVPPPDLPSGALLISRRVPIERWPDVLERQPDDVKVVLELGAQEQPA
jgi:hypothetical protein